MGKEKHKDRHIQGKKDIQMPKMGKERKKERHKKVDRQKAITYENREKKLRKKGMRKARYGERKKERKKERKTDLLLSMFQTCRCDPAEAANIFFSILSSHESCHNLK